MSPISSGTLPNIDLLCAEQMRLQRYYYPPGIGDRHLHDDDMEKLFRFRYDQHIYKAIEALINTRPGHERRVLRTRDVTWQHLADS